MREPSEFSITRALRPSYKYIKNETKHTETGEKYDTRADNVVKHNTVLKKWTHIVLQNE